MRRASLNSSATQSASTVRGWSGHACLAAERSPPQVWHWHCCCRASPWPATSQRRANSNPFHDDIAWLSDYGITTGFGDGTYRPSDPVTRQAMAAFMHRLSNQFEVVSNSIDLPPNNAFGVYAYCPGDKRPITGGGYTSTPNMFITDSFPSGDSWAVRWESEDNVIVDPTTFTAYATCAPPRL
ncbi:MAG: S-layer homology domain-containing protein [Candidatus Limnocylindrales bacterium]